MVVSSLALGLLAPAVQASFIQPDEANSKDVWISQDLPVNAELAGFGGSLAVSYVPVGNHSTSTLLQFNLTGVTLAPDQHATLGLFVKHNDTGLPGDDATATNPVSLSIYANTGSWDETTVIWDIAPTTESVAAASATVNGVNQWVTFDITNLVQQWLDDPSTNFGITLAQTAPANTLFSAYFESSASADASHRPYLATPEPTSLALLSLGTLAMLRRRRSRQYEAV